MALATGMPAASRPCATVVPNTPLDGRTSGSIARGTPKISSTSASQARSRRLNNWVRDAFVASQACTAPPVRFQSSQASMVPAHRSPAAARRLPSGSESQQPADLAGGEQRVDREAGARLEQGRRGLARRSSSQKAVVRRHCHTMTGPSGAPGRAVPHQHGLALVGDADGRQAAVPGGSEALVDGVPDGPHSDRCVLLDPAGLREGDRHRPFRHARPPRCGRRTAGPSCWWCPGRSRGCGVQAQTASLFPADQGARGAPDPLGRHPEVLEQELR